MPLAKIEKVFKFEFDGLLAFCSLRSSSIFTETLLMGPSFTKTGLILGQGVCLARVCVRVFLCVACVFARGVWVCACV